MKTWTLQVKLSISDNWIEDGANPSTKEWIESIEENLCNLLPYAYEHEFKVVIKVLSTPDMKKILQLQGY